MRESVVDLRTLISFPDADVLNMFGLGIPTSTQTEIGADEHNVLSIKH